MFLDDEAYEWFAVLLKHMGRERAAIHESSGETGLRMVRGRTAQTQLLSAGERPFASCSPATPFSI